MRRSESGNAIVFILIGIALFAALAATFMRGSQQGQGNLTTQQAKLIATQLISHGRSLEQGINKMRQKGCSETQISVSGGYFAAYSEANAPSDYSCHLFRPEGGGATSLTTAELPPTKNNDASSFRYRITALNQIQTTPSTKSDLIVHISVNDAICKSINVILGFGDTIPDDPNGVASVPFSGLYYDSAPASVSAPAGTAGCVHVTKIGSTTLDENHFFYALLAR